MVTADYRRLCHNIPRSLFFLLVLVAGPITFSASSSAQTTIVVIRTPDEILLGADSKALFAGRETRIDSVCKLYQVGNVFFAAAGLTHDAARGFNVPQIVGNAFKKSSTMRGKITAAEASLKQALSKELARLKVEDKQNYKREVDPNTGGISIAFASFENGTPFVFVKAFRTKVRANSRDSVVTVRSDTCPGNCPSGVKVFYLGHDEAIKRFLAVTTLSKPPEEVVRTLIQIEIEAKPDDVGPPIDILRVTKEKAEWVQKKDLCAEILTPAKQ